MSVVTDSNTTRSVHMEVQARVHVDRVVDEDDADNGPACIITLCKLTQCGIFDGRNIS